MSAVLASLFEIELYEAPDVMPCRTGSEEWRKPMDAWLAKRNLMMLAVGAFHEDGTMASYPGFQMLLCDVLNYPVLEDGKPLRHAVVASEGKIVHDPFPGGKQENLWPSEYVLLMSINPAQSSKE